MYLRLFLALILFPPLSNAGLCDWLFKTKKKETNQVFDFSSEQVSGRGHYLDNLKLKHLEKISSDPHFFEDQRVRDFLINQRSFEVFVVQSSEQTKFNAMTIASFKMDKFIRNYKYDFSIILKRDTSYKTLLHEVKHVEDFTEFGNAWMVWSQVNSKSNSHTLAKLNQVVIFTMEYRAYLEGYRSLIDDGLIKEAQLYKDTFHTKYVLEIDKVIDELSSDTELYQRIRNFIYHHCKNELNDFRIQSFLPQDFT